VKWDASAFDPRLCCLHGAITSTTATLAMPHLMLGSTGSGTGPPFTEGTAQALYTASTGPTFYGILQDSAVGPSYAQDTSSCFPGPCGNGTKQSGR
jgi:hypothetical protein